MIFKIIVQIILCRFRETVGEKELPFKLILCEDTFECPVAIGEVVGVASSRYKIPGENLIGVFYGNRN